MARTLAGLLYRPRTGAVPAAARTSSSPGAPWGWAAILMTLFVTGASHADGPVIAWGSNGSLWPPTSVDGTDGTAMDIATGNAHSCAIQAETWSVVCWGADYLGRA